MYEARGTTVEIGGRTIVTNADLAVAAGEVVAMIGPNGAGKSTLLRAMAGDRRIAAGSIRINGDDVATLSARELASRRAVLGQSVALNAPYTVDEVVRLGLPETVRTAAGDALVERGLAAVSLEEFAPRTITTLSGGEQQRVHAARVLVQLWAQPEDGRPRYLLLDEPTAHLDPAHQTFILKLARAHALSGGGVLAVLHDLNLAAAAADTIAVLDRGAIIARGPPAAILSADLLQQVYGVAFDVTTAAGRLSVSPRYAD
jgi:iron complex transport system ATP-binding protein